MGPAGAAAHWLSCEWTWGLALLLIVVLVYSPVWWAGYVWDDEPVVTANPVIVGPLGLREIWTTSAADICPLTITTFWMEYHLWGLSPLGYHLINVLFHGSSSLVLWRILRQLRVRGAWFGAALWALHPVLVESVAWVAELKNCQATFFYLLTILFFTRWLKADERERKFRDWNYVMTIAFAVLAMASKSSTVILPAVLWLCAWWLEGQWKWRTALAVAPTLLFSGMAAMLTLWIQRSADFGQIQESWPERLIVAGYAIWFYLGKLIWPYPSLAIYPRWNVDATDWIEYLPLSTAVALLVLFWMNRKKGARAWFFAFGYFVIALLPVLGLVQQAYTRYSFVADHFQNLACMGPLALVGAGLICLRDRANISTRWIHSAGCAALVLIFGLLSWSNVWAYKDTESLWTKTVAWNPNSSFVRYNLAEALGREGRLEEAAVEYQRALAIDPDYFKAHLNMGSILIRMGRIEEAIVQCQAAVKIDPNIPLAHSNLGVALVQAGRVKEGIEQYQMALRLQPDYKEAQDNLARAQAILQKRAGSK